MPLLKLQKASKSEKGKVGPKKGKGDGFVDDPLVKGDKSFKSRNMAEPTKSKISEGKVVKESKKGGMNKPASGPKEKMKSGISKKEAKTEKGTKSMSTGKKKDC